VLNDIFTTGNTYICISQVSFGREKHGFSPTKTPYFSIVVSGMNIYWSIVLLGKFAIIKRLIIKRISHNQTNFHMNNWLITRK
jgi:hypothetical protein